MAEALVDITLPSGEAATVPERDLSQALAAGARVTTTEQADRRAAGGLLGEAAALALGAGRSASLGASDLFLTEAANIVGGAEAKRDMQRGLRVVKEANPWATLGGEAAGLFIGGGEGILAAGEGVGATTAARLGEGMLGRVASMGARGAAETALMGVGQAVSEDALGDPDALGQKLAATVGTSALLGAGLGAVLGVGAYYGGQASSLLRGSRGPVAHRLLDEAVGLEGAGARMREEAAAAESLVGEAQKAGLPSREAAALVDDAMTLAKARTSSGPISGIVDDLAGRYMGARAGASEELREVFAKSYAERASRLARQEEILDTQARSLADRATRVMRRVEDTANEVQFAYKADQMAKLVDSSRFELARDTTLRAMQDADSVLRELEATRMKGGSEVTVRRLRKTLEDLQDLNAKIEINASQGARTQATRDLFIRLDNFKREVGRAAQFGKSPFGLSEAAHEFDALYHRLKSTLEDESAWGQAANAQREWNETFSSFKGRRDDFQRRFSISVDSIMGRPVPEADAGKLKGFLKQLGGAEGDQGVKSTEAFIDGLRAREAAIRKYGDLTPKQLRDLETGLGDLREFEATFRGARKEAEVISKLQQMQLEEQGKGLGGVLGLGVDIMTRPATTMERLASVKAAAERFEKSIAAGLDRFVSGKGAKLSEALSKPRAEVIKQIGQVRELAANPVALQERVARVVGDLTQHAPKVAQSVSLAAMRGMQYLAMEAPPGRVPLSPLGRQPEPRYSDQQLADWYAKAEAVRDPRTVLDDMARGRINRDAIRAIEFVYPAVFEEIQKMAIAKVAELDATGKLDSMSYQQRAAMAALLKVPADETWEAAFIGAMQQSKAAPPPQAQPAAPQQGVSKRKVEMNTDIFQTEAARIEAGGV